MSVKQTPFSSVLVANRGEIALRVMRSVRAAGMRCIAVYTTADKDAPHVAFADEAVLIGDGPVGDSYLRADKILAAAAETGAEAIHPGYGFLSESAAFSKAVADAGLVFIGPSAEAIDVMGNKAAAKRRMLAADVPCVPGYEGEDQADATFVKVAEDIGYPVMIKAAAGGGGRGMRLVADPADLVNGLTLAKSEALNAFGSDEIILEKAIIEPRHVEVQVFADRSGHTVHLGERDCSVQRRHQKVVEEAPCPVMTPELRAAMGEAAVNAAQAVNYEGAGTVEFLLDASGAFYFLEMNTRLQVEHPVTELVTGLDLVQLQLKVAAGQPLGFGQDDVSLKGHAIEVRLYAEDPANDFLPATGDVVLWQKAEGPALRIDDGIATGQTVSPFYDPMIAKVIACGPDREAARRSLIRGLKDSVLFGPATNRDFLISVLEKSRFAAGEATTAFIAQEYAEGMPEANPPDFRQIAATAALLFRADQQRHAAAAAVLSPELLGWGSGGQLKSVLKLGLGETVHELQIVQVHDGRLTVTCDEDIAEAVFSGDVLRINGTRQEVTAFTLRDGDVFVALGARSFTFRRISAIAGEDETGDGSRITAPMHGSLLELLVSDGDSVKAGDRLAILEAMKMQHELLAQADGTVSAVIATAGSQVSAGDLLIEIDVEES